MSEEEQEKLYELLFKDTKNKLEATIEKLRIANAELRDELDKKNSEIEEQQNKIASLQKEIKLMKSININDNYISKDKVLKALGYEENDEEYKRIYNKEELILSLIQTIFEECDRLEDIEDRKVQVEIKNIENRRDKYWKDKIRERIKMNEELIKEPSKWKYTENEIRNFKIENMCLEELLEENNKCK